MTEKGHVPVQGLSSPNPATFNTTANTELEENGNPEPIDAVNGEETTKAFPTPHLSINCPKRLSLMSNPTSEPTIFKKPSFSPSDTNSTRSKLKSALPQLKRDKESSIFSRPSTDSWPDNTSSSNSSGSTNSINPITPCNSLQRIENALKNPLLVKLDVSVTSRRDKVAQELLETEQRYISSLITMDELYRQPLLEASRRNLIPLSESQVHEIFSPHFDDIIRVNMVLLDGLVGRLQNWGDCQCLGDLLLELVPFLKTYTSYTGNYERSNELAKDIENKKEGAVAKFFENCPVRPPLLSLCSYLIMPIQRIPRYRLLLEELIKSTPEDHIDLPDLIKALESIKIVANQIDMAISEHENRAQMLDIQENFTGEKIQIIEVGRVFLRKGELTKVCRKDTQKRMFWLFSDMLLYAKQAIGGRYAKPRRFDLSSATIKCLPDHPGKSYNAFQVATHKKSFVVLASSLEDKNQWVLDINTAIVKLEDAAKTFKNKSCQRNLVPFAPVWVPDSEVLCCTICRTKFNLIARRHHCRQCGNVVCGACSSKKKNLPGQGIRRVCDRCLITPYPEINLSTTDHSTINSTDQLGDKETTASSYAEFKPRNQLYEGTDGHSLKGSDGRTSQLGEHSPVVVTPEHSSKVNNSSDDNESTTTHESCLDNNHVNSVSKIDTKHQYIALYDYPVSSDDPKKLGFAKGDVLRVLKQTPTGWWMAKLGLQIGWVPSSYLVHIDAHDTTKEAITTTTM